MQRFAIPLIAGIAVIALILTGLVGGTSFFRPIGAAAQSSTPTAASGMGHGQMLPSQLQFLSSMTPQERFDHFTGGQMSWINPQGQSVVLTIVPGKVTAVTANTVTIQPNGTTTTRTFNLTANTLVRGTPHPGSLAALAPGDRVVVTTVGNTNDATSITAPNFARNGMAGHMPGREMMPTPTGSTPAPATATRTP